MSNNTPLSSFASAATGSKSSITSNVKVSSAELLSMLKKPTGAGLNVASATTNNNSNNNSNGNSNVAQSINLNGPTSASAFTESTMKPFKDDDYTLQGLINLIKACQSADRNIFALGVDLENDIGLAMNQEEPLRESLLSPWYDESVNVINVNIPSGTTRGDRDGDNRKGSVGLLGLEGNCFPLLSGQHPTKPNGSTSALDSIIPACYHVPSLPNPVTKISSFSDETLFYIFYAMPGDRMQELAARELFGRGWRFYKPSKSWLCPADPSEKEKDLNLNSTINTPTVFFIFDQSTWIKVKRSLTLQADDLELSRPHNSGTASPVSNPEIMHGSGTLHSTSVTH